MKKALRCLPVCALVGALFSCNNYNNTNPYGTTTGITGTSFPVTAYVSNPVQPNGLGGGSPALDVLDATRDLLSVNTISLASLSASVTGAGMMAVSPNRAHTLVFSPNDNRMAIITNGSESASTPLAGSTESFFVWNDSATAFVAEPNASVPGQSPGAVQRINLSTGGVTASIPVAAAHYIVPSPDGSAILAFSDDSDVVTLITPSLLNSGQSNTVAQCTSTQAAVCTLPQLFDRPVWAVFSGSGSTAYILSCGQQCGGAGAGACLTYTSCTTVAVLDMTQKPPTVTGSIAVPAATIGALQGNVLFVAGTPALAADNTCAGASTAAAACGRLSVIDLASVTVTTTLTITDGYHNRLQATPGGQLFLGSRGCSNVNLTGGEERGCLTILNSNSASVAQASVIVPPDNGDVTGIEPIPNRPVVYVCEGGHLRIYSTSTDQLEKFTLPNTAPSIAGQAVDVKVVTF